MCFFTLVSAYVNSDFSILNVFENSFQDKPLIYKISGVWGNHEGSFLLLIFIIAMLALFALKPVQRNLQLNYNFFSCLVVLILSCYLYFTSNPFQMTQIYFEARFGP